MFAVLTWLREISSGQAGGRSILILSVIWQLPFLRSEGKAWAWELGMHAMA